jgi:hypothetical protein
MIRRTSGRSCDSPLPYGSYNPASCNQFIDRIIIFIYGNLRDLPLEHVLYILIGKTYTPCRVIMLLPTPSTTFLSLWASSGGGSVY